jgi:prepilin-type N-terminal cleavage/methylation domain-containing protein
MRPVKIQAARWANQRGFTLNETLVAMALMGLGILGLSVNTSGIIQGVRASETMTVATHLAQDKMEELKAQKTLAEASNCSASLAALEPAERNLAPTGRPGGIYDRCWIIQDSPLSAGLKQIAVSVSWRDPVSRSVTMTTLVYPGQVLQ